jgi:hypothetical protein
LGSVQSGITQVLQRAQADARVKRSARAVVFDTNLAPTPRAAILPFTPGGNACTDPGDVPDGSWQTLGTDIPTNFIILEGFGGLDSGKCIVFDSNGAIATVPVVQTGITQLSDGVPFIMAARTRRNGTASQNPHRCIRIETLLGGISAGDVSGQCRR